MDPSLSLSSDPQHHPPPQFAGFPFAPFAAGGIAASQSHPFFSGAVNPASVAASNNHVFQAPPLSQPPPTNAPPPAPQSETSAPTHPSFSHPPYSDMICSAIAALNESDGSSKQAISRYIERVFTGLPLAHGALLTHHLKTLKNSGILVMVKKSYKFASTPPPTSIAVAAAAGLEDFRSDPPSYTTTAQPQSDQTGLPAAASAPTAQKRGRGRPPKPKPDIQPSEAPVQLNGQPHINWEQNNTSVSGPAEEVQPARRPPGRPPGRPRKNGPAAPAPAPAPDFAAAGITKRRGRPPGRRAAGGLRKPKSVAAPATVFAYVANGAKRRGRPKRVNTGVAVAPFNTEGGEAAAVILPAKRRGRPPKIGGVIRKPVKPKRGVSRTGRPVGRPRKDAQWATGGGYGQQDAGYGELKRKFDFLHEKVKEAVNLLKEEATSENQAVVRAIQELEGLTAMDTTCEPHGVEEVQQEEPNPEPESHQEDQLQEQGQAQTEAEAMQEALF
ncbi:PREDICTED: LOW QUALITY PROTEIN: uncharacterized protein LOC104821833 [Tarenaya hassleriana]|uniref:LOW QUALITY PROTEIN: uncharacterized protein LOC104821833 n=1 Tax=Tarenaya hassleriana TaxID=28532 RepID=UPI0008FD7832|nr:PREDICTED: LOW QUALITY PROTEIN: uncharacterized protein LOC104821833 [Tarenaya hassleriana]